jgi:hypothetical protein
MFDGQGTMYLDSGFKKFARIHNLVVRCLLHFLYEGEDDVSVRVLDDLSRCRHYHIIDSDEDNETISCKFYGVLYLQRK